MLVAVVFFALVSLFLMVNNHMETVIQQNNLVMFIFLFATMAMPVGIVSKTIASKQSKES